MVVKIKRFGWIADLPDHRDLMYAAPMQVLTALPTTTDLRSQCPPVYDQGQLGSCFVAGTRVTMGDYSEKPIEQIEEGEYVMNQMGEKREVTKTFKRGYTGPLYALKISGIDYPIMVTPEHPIAIRHNIHIYERNGVLLEQQTSFLQIKDIDMSKKPYVVIPKIDHRWQNEQTLDVREMIAEELHHDGQRIWAVGTSKKYSIPINIRLDSKFNRLLGLFLAEGSYRKWNTGKINGINFTFNRKESDLVSFVVETMREIFGVEPEVKQTYKRPSITDVTLSNVTVALLMKQLCGEYSYHKTLSPLLFEQPIHCKIALLRGWMEGDGQFIRVVSKRNGMSRKAAQLSAVTMSEDLHRDMFRLSLSCGLKPSCKVRTEDDGKVAFHSRSITFYSNDVIKIYPQCEDELREAGVYPTGRVHHKSDESNFYCKLLSVTETPVNNLAVYNLEVDTDNTYIANFVLVHNCTANAIAGAVEFDLMKENKKEFMPSRLFIYYNERVIEGTVDSDSGAQIRDGVKSVASQGDCPEDLWPYDINKFTGKPSQNCYDNAVQHKAVQYQRVIRDLNQMKGCLASGYPFVFGFTVYQSFESQEVAQTGHASMPSSGEQAVGGHAVLAVGYDDSQNWFVVRNSWGTSWGMKGYFTLPYSYLLNANLADDFWTIRVVN